MTAKVSYPISAQWKKRHKGKRPLGRPRRRWEHNVKKYLQEVEWKAWSGLIWLRIWTR